jgi:hypothetical protein
MESLLFQIGFNQGRDMAVVLNHQDEVFWLVRRFDSLLMD